MPVPTATSSTPAPPAERPAERRLLRPRAWDAIAVLGLVGLLTAIDLRGRFHAHVRLSHTRWLSAPSALAVLAAVTIVAALVGRRRETAGLLGLAGVFGGLAASWLLLGRHRWAGPVLADFGDDHGLHVADFLACVPLAIAAVLVLLAWRRRA